MAFTPVTTCRYGPRVAAEPSSCSTHNLSGVVRLTVDDVIHDDQVFLWLGEPPSPVPAPVVDLLLSWIPNRDNLNTAMNRDSHWLFPGCRAGQPMHPRHPCSVMCSAGQSHQATASSRAIP